MKKISDICIYIRNKGRLKGTLFHSKFLPFNFSLLGLQFIVIKIKIAHFSFKLFLDVQSLPKLMIAILKFHLTAFLLYLTLIQFSSFMAKHIADTLGNNHQRFKCLLQSTSHTFQKTISGEKALSGFWGRLEQLLPYLVGSHVEAKTYCAEGRSGRFYGCSGRESARLGANEGIKL